MSGVRRDAAADEQRLHTMAMPSSTATEPEAGGTCHRCGARRPATEGGPGADLATAADQAMSPVDRVLSGTTWDHESMRLAIDAAGLAASLLLLYIRLNDA